MSGKSSQRKGRAAALTAAGVHPVNWEELTHGG